MSGGFNGLRERVVALLRENGVNAVPAGAPEPAGRWREATAAVSVKRVRCADSGFQNYLGSEANGSRVTELYGRAADITLAIDVYAPPDGGEGACQETAEKIAELLLTRGAGGLEPAEWTAERAEWLDREGMYRLRTECLCRAWLTVAAEAEGGPGFTDFEVKGRKA